MATLKDPSISIKESYEGPSEYFISDAVDHQSINVMLSCKNDQIDPAFVDIVENRAKIDWLD